MEVAMSNRNPHARALSNALFRKRIVKAKKGKGAYNRKRREKNDA
jgi:stalled ribosome alternative rescue factor ArfA